MRALAIAAAVAGSLVALTAEAEPPTRTVTVEVTLPATAHVDETFDAKIRIVNTTGVKQSFTMMSCSWTNQWRTDDPTIGRPGANCDKNVPHTVDLPPGAVDTRTLPLVVLPKAAIGEHAFRVGFAPDEDKTTDKTAMVWSTSVKMQILAAVPHK